MILSLVRIAVLLAFTLEFFSAAESLETRKAQRALYCRDALAIAVQFETAAQLPSVYAALAELQKLPGKSAIDDAIPELRADPADRARGVVTFRQWLVDSLVRQDTSRLAGVHAAGDLLGAEWATAETHPEIAAACRLALNDWYARVHPGVPVPSWVGYRGQ